VVTSRDFKGLEWTGGVVRPIYGWWDAAPSSRIRRAPSWRGGDGVSAIAARWRSLWTDHGSCCSVRAGVFQRGFAKMAWWLAVVSREDATASMAALAGFRSALFLWETPDPRKPRTKVLRPIYPGYLFVHASGALRPLMDLSGVLTMVRSEDRQVAEVPDAVVDDRIGVAVSSDPPRYVLPLAKGILSSPFAAGDVVEVVGKRAWEHHEGVVEVCCGDGTSAVRMQIMGRLVRVTFADRDLRLVHRPRRGHGQRRFRKRNHRVETLAAAA
jgi:hypothetical protein